MPTADAALARQATSTTAMAPVSTSVCGWGGGEGAPVLLVQARDVNAARAAVSVARAAALDPRVGTEPAGAIPRGMGRSYGDAAQLVGGLVLDTTALKGFELNRREGVLTAGAGMTIGEILEELVPAGLMLPVVPGTQHVTVGGAIASDIHGKNHGAVGTFGSHLLGLGLLTSSGEVLELEPRTGDGVFEATIGGMGLTGVILWARIALLRVGSALLSVDSDRVQSLDGALAALRAPGGPYRVAWLDLLCSRPGRGIVTRAQHVDDQQVERREIRSPAAGRAGPTVRSRASVPRRWPDGLLRPSTVGAFNELRYRRAPGSERARTEGIGAHMFPLDALEAWPRLYGRGGLIQYQLVVPTGREWALERVIERLRAAHVPCYLAVLKDFGPANAFPLSFPLEGWTLALDLPRGAPGLGGVLDELDRLVAEAGGRVYLSKDARMRPEAIAAMYPRLQAWRQVRELADPHHVWRSDLALRTGLIEVVR